jgi:flagellar hook assembly protein FlgD
MLSVFGTGFAAAAGAVYQGSTYMSRVFDLSDAVKDSQLSFDWKLSAGNKTLTLEVYNGLNQLINSIQIQGDTDWTAIEPITLTKGDTYNVKWVYTNNDATGDDSQTAWVDKYPNGPCLC